MIVIGKVWKSITTWLEHGDLVPLIILVSAYHYATILRQYDAWLSAVAIGTLVDLGHYRLVRLAVRYTGSDNRERFARWFFVLVLTAVALNYQQRFYNDWWLSVPLPALIVSLAWLSQRDERTGQRRQASPVIATVTISEPASEPSETVSEIVPAGAASYICKVCGDDFNNRFALSGHMRKHKGGK